MGVEESRRILAESMSEAEFQASVLDVFYKAGWDFIFHVGRSDKGIVTSTGFPDLLAIHSSRPDILVAELKRERDRTDRVRRIRQAAWLKAFEVAGIDAYRWRPSDMDLIIARVTRTRKTP